MNPMIPINPISSFLHEDPGLFLTYIEIGFDGFFKDICPIFHANNFLWVAEFYLRRGYIPNAPPFNGLSDADRFWLERLIGRVRLFGYGMSDKMDDGFTVESPFKAEEDISNSRPISVFQAADIYVQVVYLNYPVS
jgi:hypothetical protein